MRPWEGAAHALPGLVLWGGPTDFCIVDFATTSHNLEAGMVDGGHYLVECIHNCNHSQPPLEPLPGHTYFDGMWDFVLSHPYWLPPGTSPYQTGGLPETLPAWCGQGAGSATIRAGDCEAACSATAPEGAAEPEGVCEPTVAVVLVLVLVQA